ncbi:MAG: PLP-dependent aminotransferase family protein [Betaproteobacteria bacterium]|jgi:GntR family transcriptional regulator/MocR family aminotransferase
MRRPQQFQWAHLFALPEQPALPLQTRLRLSVVQALLEGRLPAGAALPSSRELARLLGISRNTVTAAYEQLVEEGFLQARPRSGIFVAEGARTASALSSAQAMTAQAPRRTSGEGQAPDWTGRTRRSLARASTLSKPQQWRQYPYPFVYGHYDPELFPTEDFRECCSRSLARVQLQHWTPDFETDDVPDLIEQIRLRLLPKRGVFALPEEILVTVGAQHAYHLLAEGLFDADTRVGLEEPGHPHARNTFSLRQPQFVPAPVDDDGVQTGALQALDYLFVTPSHQSPTTATMSLARRAALLARAERDDFVLIEDDYEAENLFAGSPMPALKSMDKSGRVIYVGSLSKSLSPALRLAYIVAPRALIAELRLLRHAMVRHPSTLLQQAYALFLSLGHHESHARRVNAALQERLAVLAQALRDEMPDFSFRLPQGGASVWVSAPAWADAAELAHIARGHGVLIEPGDVFFLSPPYPCRHFRLRLSSIPAAQIAPGIRALSLAADELARARGATRRPTPALH